MNMCELVVTDLCASDTDTVVPDTADLLVIWI